MRYMPFIIVSVLFSLTVSAFAKATESNWLEVIDPYIEMHTGPGRGYPVFHVIEEGERIQVITRRPDWFEVRMENGKLGWTHARQIARTIQATGVPADIPTVSQGDYLKNSWRVGFSSGQFNDGEIEGSELFSLNVGYRPLNWLSVELEAGKLFGAEIQGDFMGGNFLIEPFSHWPVSPVVLVGFGSMQIDSQPKLVPTKIDDSDYQQYGLGFNYYLGRNFLFKGDYRAFELSTDNDNVSLAAWTIGLNTFF